MNKWIPAGAQYQNTGARVNYSDTLYQYPGSLNQNNGAPYLQGVPIQLPGIDFLVVENWWTKH